MRQTVVQLSHRTRAPRVVAGFVLWAALLTLAPPSARAMEPITADTVAERVAAAKTAQDHQELAAYYRSQAAAMATSQASAVRRGGRRGPAHRRLAARRRRRGARGGVTPGVGTASDSALIARGA
jgi:hypothetical protein